MKYDPLSVWIFFFSGVWEVTTSGSLSKSLHYASYPSFCLNKSRMLFFWFHLQIPRNTKVRIPFLQRNYQTFFLLFCSELNQNVKSNGCQ